MSSSVARLKAREFCRSCHGITICTHRKVAPSPESALVAHRHKVTVETRARAEKKAVGRRSQRVATRCQSSRRSNMMPSMGYVAP